MEQLCHDDLDAAMWRLANPKQRRRVSHLPNEAAARASQARHSAKGSGRGSVRAECYASSGVDRADGGGVIVTVAGRRRRTLTPWTTFTVNSSSVSSTVSASTSTGTISDS